MSGTEPYTFNDDLPDLEEAHDCSDSFDDDVDSETRELIRSVKLCLSKHAPEIMDIDDRINDVTVGWKNGQLHFLVGVDEIRTWYEIRHKIPSSLEELPVDFYVERPNIQAFAAASRDSSTRFDEKRLRRQVDGASSGRRRDRGISLMVSRLLHLSR